MTDFVHSRTAQQSLNKEQILEPNFHSSLAQLYPTTFGMASLLAGTAAFAALGLGARYSLRSAARNGARLNPLLAAIAGTEGKGGAQEWVKGGFQAKMDRKEAAEILGLR